MKSYQFPSNMYLGIVNVLQDLEIKLMLP